MERKNVIKIKRILSVVLAVILLVFCTGCGSNESGNISNPAQSIEDSPVSDFEYKVDSTGIIITKYIGSKTDVKIPSVIEGKRVVSIMHAFEGCNALKSVIIPDGVKYIEYKAFKNCTELINITIPKSVTLIADDVFHGCTELKSITIPNSVTDIGARTFKGCTKLKNVSIPNSVKKIYYDAFVDCTANITYKGKTYTPDNYDALYEAARGY